MVCPADAPELEVRGSGYSAMLWSERCESALHDEASWVHRSSTVPLQQRSIWPSASEGEQWFLLDIVDEDSGRLNVGLRSYRMRSIPGGRILRVLKFGPGLPTVSLPRVIHALREVAKKMSGVVRLHIELCQVLAPETIASIVDAAERQGFVQTLPREYEHTLLVPLNGSHGETPRFHRSVLKNARKTLRAGHQVQPISDERFVARLDELLVETMTRGGGRTPSIRMQEVVRRTREYPKNFRLVGLFRDGVYSPSSLMAFRWCGCAGDYADDLLAASTRWSDADGQVPMMHAIMLDILAWAELQGASVFDFGGVVLPDDPRAARLATISRFKELFFGRIERVGVDLNYVASPFLSAIGQAISRVAR
jgi:hypothetical protein